MIELANASLRLGLGLKGGIVERFDAVTSRGPVPIFWRGRGSTGPLCFPLVPFGNRLRDNRFSFEARDYALAPNTDADKLYLHGDGWLGDWSLIGRTDTEAVLGFSHAAAGAPYAYRAEQRFRIVDRTLAVDLSVTNTGSRRMPFGLGLHPFLPLTPRTEIRFEATHYWEQDGDFLPLLRRPAAGAFDFSAGRPVPHRWTNTEFEGWTGSALIGWPESGATLEVTAGPVFTRCMMFVSSRSFDPLFSGDWFCFEPMTHGVDAHHRADGGGLVALAPGKTLVGGVRFHASFPD